MTTHRAGGAALLLLAALVLGGCRAPAAQGTVTLDLDWDSCDDGQWTATGQGGLEAGSEPERQSVITARIRRVDHGCANRFEVRNRPTDVNTGFRALWARYDSNEGTTGGTDFVYGLSFRLATIPAYVHIWELHQRENIYRVDPDLSLAPHALLIRDGALQYRLMAGAARWERGEWSGWSNAQDQQVLLPDLVPGTWYDVMVRIRAREGGDGLTQVFARRAGAPWPSAPTWENRGPSLPHVPGGFDPRIPDDIDVFHPVPGPGGQSGLYLLAGLYTGSSRWVEPDPSVQLHLDELRRYTDLDTARAGFPR